MKCRSEINMEVKRHIIIITSFLELLERLFHPRDNFRGDNVYCHRSIVNAKCSLAIDLWKEN